MDNCIEHKGVVFDIVGKRIDVAMETDSACISCKVKGACGMGESERKNISAIVEHPSAFGVGEKVIVSVTKAMGIKAVVLAYIAPLLLMIAVLAVTLLAGMGEVAAGLATLGAAAVWYVVLWLFRNRIGQEIKFKIRKDDE